MRKHLILGMSHTESIRHHLLENPNPDIFVLNVRRANLDRFVEAGNFKPEVLCLSVRGNQHSYLALCEHPRKYGIGGVHLEDDADRQIIPYHLFEAYFRSILQKVENAVPDFISKFPEAELRLICPPPPRHNLSAVTRLDDFIEKSRNGFCPANLRRAVYEIQANYYAEIADKFGATFIPPPRRALTDLGLLADEFSSDDPSHANRFYGGLVIEQILACERAAT